MIDDAPDPTTGSSAESTAPRRLQRILFQPTDEIASQDLYVKMTRGRVVGLKREEITIAPFSTASTRTYFGRFPAAYFQRWTAIRSVSIRGWVQGRGRIRAYASDDVDRERIVGVADVDSLEAVPFEIALKLDRFLDGGFLWLDLEAGDGDLSVGSVRFESENDAEPSAVTVVICTHNRADDCLNTLDALVSDDAALAAVEKIIVVDQGDDRVESRTDRFASIRDLLGTRLAYITQANLGGAGGFTRGIWEAMSDGREDGDIILMDDDIVLEPETLLRMSAFSARAINPVIVGAQMLYLYHPNVLHTSAEDADLETLRAGVPVHDREQGLDLRKKLPYRWAEGGYNAWWTCLVPRSVVRSIGYPLPIFFQWDDIEYGLRARANDIPTVTLPGSAVWHADFALKDRDDWSRYFSYRNSLIVAALHGRWNSKRIAATLFHHLLEMIMSLHYGLAATTILAIDGFLAGPDTVRDGSADALARVREVRSRYPDTVRHRPEEMVETGLFSLPAINSGGYPRIPWLVKVKRSLWQVLGLNKRVGKISSADSNWYHSSQFRKAIVTDAALDSFRIRAFDPRIAMSLIRSSAVALWRLRRRGSDAAAAWREAQNGLTERAAWSRIFDATRPPATTPNTARRSYDRGAPTPTPDPTAADVAAND
ncbi:glycosyltransferase [Microbacterium sp. HA-8]|uniref:glycosyltransferase n=1 Tax=Microbacterium sp. HA-8 TaxID=3234200 RepID=UPI0038F7C352